ncbi:DUF4870 domain-containing protein [Spongiibacter sp. KMU-158]|uniref:DUF4870 domain-containing protein n=1 Tax=Spongiibacter pelagi TaxID=2760804 RepID=A0A927GUT6_9GAMM|nr:DUF4870 domain-containing protein [Spongiibacter pelagi]MBD2857373.1 DUF4870 domain-containing protein [Spongiibacter pelagi]
MDQDSKNMALLCWIGTLFFGIFSGLIFYLLKKDDRYVLEQSKEAMNWSITVLAGYIVAYLLSFIGIGLILLPIIGICHLVFCILGIIGSYKGDSFQVPFAFRLIK